jgi:tRNA guanosine-2'-O-methyltransferase
VILCASLVDKVPNLAGLARTCEIFNATALIVPNARVIEDEAFQTISVTAHKWIHMQEVKEGAPLLQALAAWKADSYSIVAVEQTASSVCLSHYTLPDKMVIVLGKEKERIPVSVLAMVDVCVEIPQFGLIRSLNVHVSGAILLWEYTVEEAKSASGSRVVESS